MEDDERDIVCFTLPKPPFRNGRIDKIRSALPKKTDPDVNELLGALVGDGWLGISGRVRRRKQVCLCGNLRTEMAYRRYLQDLIKRTLKVNGYYQERQAYNTYYIIINSDSIFDFFENNFGFPVGTKRAFDTTLFPREWTLQKRVIRGIFDTDGSLFFDNDPRYKRPYPVLDITLKNKELLGWMARILNKHGFRAFLGRKSIRLKGVKNLHKWFKYISPKNEIHRRKYSSWVKKIGLVAQLG